MDDSRNSDNIFAEGSLIAAKINPSTQLRIMKYYQHIYYCVVADDLNSRQLAYFEHELIAPKRPQNTLERTPRL